MVEFESADIIRFLMQLFAATAGASSLWIFVLFRKYRKSGQDLQEGFYRLAKILTPLFFASFVFFLVNWVLAAFFTSAYHAFAHEGIVLHPHTTYIQNGLEFGTFFVLALSLLVIFVMILFYKYENLFRAYGEKLFLGQFLLISVILAFSVYVGQFGRDQLFFSMHSWHSILTLGTVLTVDYLYIASFTKDNLKRVLYPFFPIMSGAIWLGLGIDFLSVALIFQDAMHVTQQFLFNQTVVAVLIINGALLSGKINDMLIALIKPDRVLYLSQKANLIFGVAGSISIISWFTITFLDFFNPRLAYWEYLGIYAALIGVAFFSQMAMKKLIFSLSTRNNIS